MPASPAPWNRASFGSKSETAIGFDTSRFPLVVIEFSAHPTPADHRVMFDACNRLASRKQRFGYVVDMRKLNPLALTPSARKDAADMYVEQLDVRRAATIREARVIENPLIRGVAVAFDWITGHHWPTATFATVAQAEDWVQTKIRTDNVRR